MACVVANNKKGDTGKIIATSEEMKERMELLYISLWKLRLCSP
jgi:hypothetical protein